jgi:hypothetical protein
MTQKSSIRLVFMRFRSTNSEKPSLLLGEVGVESWGSFYDTFLTYSVYEELVGCLYTAELLLLLLKFDTAGGDGPTMNLILSWL